MRAHLWMMTIAVVTAVIGLGVLPVGPAHAELTLCGRDWASPGDLQKLLAEVEKLPEVHRDKHYVAYQDHKTTTMWTFTLPGIPAHPAVVCRQPMKEGEALRLHMDVNCNGDERACTALVDDFQRLNSDMAREMNKRQ